MFRGGQISSTTTSVNPMRRTSLVSTMSCRSRLITIRPSSWIRWRRSDGCPPLRNNGVQAAFAYGQYLGKRYQRFANILWLNGNDFNTWKNSTDDALVQAVAKGIHSVDPDQLQTVELNVFNSYHLTIRLGSRSAISIAPTPIRQPTCRCSTVTTRNPLPRPTCARGPYVAF